MSNTISTFSAGEDYTIFYMIGQLEKKGNILMINSLLNAENIKENKIKILIDTESNNELLKRIKSLMVEYMRENALTNHPDFFWLKILFSIISGFLIFLFAAFAIPDPIPLFDEIIFAVAGGWFCYLTLAKYLLINFLPTKVIDKYLTFVNRIQVEHSSVLMRLNDIFENFYEKNITGKVTLEEDVIFLKNVIKIFSLNEILEIKEFLNILSRQYKFNKINLNIKKISKKANRSILSESRFKFYYLLHKILFRD